MPPFVQSFYLAKAKNNAWAFLTIAAVIFGFTPILTKYIAIDPSALAFWRMFLPVCLLAPFVIKQENNTNINKKAWLILSILGAIFGFDLVLWNYALNTTNIANVGAISSTAPLFVALISWFFLKEKINLSTIIALLLSFSGVSLLLQEDLLYHAKQVFGDLLALSTAVIFAIYLIGIKVVRNKFSAIQILFTVNLFAAITMLLSFLFIGNGPFIPQNSQGWQALIALAISTQLIGYGLVTYATKYVSATFLSISLLLELVVATVFAWLLFDQSLSNWQFIGIGVVLIGIFVAGRKK